MFGYDTKIIMAAVVETANEIDAILEAVDDITRGKESLTAGDIYDIRIAIAQVSGLVSGVRNFFKAEQ